MTDTRIVLSKNEHSENVKALGAYDILDTGNEAPFDAIARTAARLFRAPTALISLLDAERQWFKASVGMDCTETPLDQSFCRYAVAANSPLIVLDAVEDATFRDNPLVTGGPGIRFYAGAPFGMSGGAIIGTVCVIDTVPRTACPDDDIAALTDLAIATAELISLRAMARTLARAQDMAVSGDIAAA